ncbi:MAG: hypothetical protein IT320_05365 [Anaerolineae bacterium]|nr:hypothetical protein [Anaerolineae bacterium]
MIDVTLSRAGIREIEEVEASLKTALGGTYLGMSLRRQEAVIHLIESASDADQLLAATTYATALAAIDPGQPPPSQRRALKRSLAQQALELADFTGLKQRAGAANSVVALRAEVETLARLVWQMAAAGGLTEQDDPAE